MRARSIVLQKVFAAACAVSALSAGCAVGPPPPNEPLASMAFEFPVETTADALPEAPIETNADPRTEPRAVPRSESRASELVAWLASVVRAGPVAQKKELAQSAAAFGRAPTPYARLKLGALYAQPTPTLRDDLRAIALLEPLTAAAPSVPERPVADLASLFYAQVAERQRLAKDDAKKQEDLREQIEAMKSIERSIMQREERQHTR
jgi:hypothetical protein